MRAQAVIVPVEIIGADRGEAGGWREDGPDSSNASSNASRNQIAFRHIFGFNVSELRLNVVWRHKNCSFVSWTARLFVLDGANLCSGR